MQRFKLDSITDTATTPNILARDLMELVFTKEALAKCTLGEADPKKGTERRPGLFPDGVEATLSNL